MSGADYAMEGFVKVSGRRTEEGVHSPTQSGSGAREKSA